MEAGTTTQDLRHLAAQPPDDEKRVQRRGQQTFWTGLGIVFATFVICLAAAIISDQHVYSSRAGQLFGVLSIIPLMLLGGALMLIGGIEQNLRTVRHNQERILSQVRAQTEDNLERFDTIMGLVGPIPGRVDQLAEHMNVGGAGYLERLARIEDAMTEVARHLPDAKLKAHWRGYNDAVREGFTAEKTGTYNTPRNRPPHLGLVPPDSLPD